MQNGVGMTDFGYGVDHQLVHEVTKAGGNTLSAPQPPRGILGVR